jgi:hypothetical protein
MADFDAFGSSPALEDDSVPQEQESAPADPYAAFGTSDSPSVGFSMSDIQVDNSALRYVLFFFMLFSLCINSSA